MIYYIGEPRLIKSDLYRESTIENCYNWLIKLSAVALDTETEGFFNHRNRIIMLQLSDGTDTWVIDTRITNISLLKLVLEKILILGQNLKFDYKFLKKEGIILKNIYNTFIVECLLNNGLEVNLSLEAICFKYCGIKLDKSVRNQFIKLQGSPFTNNQIIYGSGDVQYLFKIKEEQEKLVTKYNLQSVVNLENEACLALADIEYNGLGFDSIPWLKLTEKAESNLSNYEEELDRLVLEEPKLKKFIKKYEQLSLFGEVDRVISIKWSSPTQVQKVFKEIGLDIESSSEKEIQKFQYQYPLVKKFIDYKKESKVITTYGKSFLDNINPITNRIHTEFWQIKETNRVSSNKPNLQNLPAKNEYLNCFVAAKGYKIIGIDYSGQEARIAACGSKDTMWLNTFLEGKDLHSEVCKLMFSITDDLVRTKPDFLRGKTYRDVAKTINFGVLFGMSKFKLSNTLQVSLEEADDLIKKYFKATKQLKIYLDNCAKYGLTNGYIRSYSPYSGIRFFPNWKKDLDEWEDKKIIGEITRASYNTPIQMTAALMTKVALVNTRKYIIENSLEDKVKLVHVVHDAIYTECIEEFAEEFSIIQSNIMKEAGKQFNLALPMDTDITITDFWSK
jgi:DNA polymerase I-like protein with 3'-5' exonuclease and polymerase domains